MDTEQPQTIRRISPWWSYLTTLLLLIALVLAFGLIKREMEARQTVTDSSELELKQAEADAKANPKDIGMQLLLADKYYQKGDLKKAAETYQRILERSPKNFTAAYGLGLTLEKAEDHQQALVFFEKALAVNPNNADVLYHAGFSCNQIKAYEKAAAYLEKAIALHPMISSLHYELGIAYKNLGKKSQAALEFKEALRYNPFEELSQKELEKLK